MHLHTHQATIFRPYVHLFQSAWMRYGKVTWEWKDLKKRVRERMEDRPTMQENCESRAVMVDEYIQPVWRICTKLHRNQASSQASAWALTICQCSTFSKSVFFFARSRDGNCPWCFTSLSMQTFWISIFMQCYRMCLILYTVSCAKANTTLTVFNDRPVWELYLYWSLLHKPNQMVLWFLYFGVLLKYFPNVICTVGLIFFS